MDRALEAGINFFDTADSYNHDRGDGSTEHIIGRWLAQGGSRREKVVLATKVYSTLGAWANNGKLSARHIREACVGSLRRLQTDHIDLYQMHHVDRATPWEEVWQAMAQLVQEGKILYVGSSNFAGWHIVTANTVAEKRSQLGLISEQSVYNLTKRQIELELIPACEANGVGLIPYSPLAAGLLACGDDQTDRARRDFAEVRERAVKFAKQLAQFEALCLDFGESPPSVALSWLLHQPAVTSPIIGPRTQAQLEGCLRALNISLSEDVLSRLDDIWPGPGGPAPEAYAW